MKKFNVFVHYVVRNYSCYFDILGILYIMKKKLCLFWMAEAKAIFYYSTFSSS